MIHETFYNIFIFLIVLYLTAQHTNSQISDKVYTYVLEDFCIKSIFSTLLNIS